MKIDIMGSSWTIRERTDKEDRKLEDCDGYCDWTIREIVIRREIEGNLSDMEAYARKVKRHEIVHAFLCECGLSECSGETEAWAMNETMVDWFARVGQRIIEAWQAAEALP